MPTGYTAALHDGEQSFEDFVWGAAHATGALIMLRDEGMDSPVPEFEPHTSYYDETLAKAQQRLAAAESWTVEDAEADAQRIYATVEQVWQERQRDTDALRARYEAMLARVEAWEPPTPEHVGLKELMAQQLNESIKFDCSGWDAPPLPSGEEHKAAVIEQARRDVEYATTHIAEEIERTEGRNAWVRALDAAVPRSRSKASA